MQQALPISRTHYGESDEEVDPHSGIAFLLYLPTALADPSGWWRHAQLPVAPAPQAQPQVAAPAQPAATPATWLATAAKPAVPTTREVVMNDDKPVKILSGFNQLSKESATCMSCHREKTPASTISGATPSTSAPT